MQQQHAPGDPLHVYGIQISLHKITQLDKYGSPVLDSTGNQVLKCGFRIGGGIDQNPSRCPHGYPDKGIYVTSVEERGAAALAGLQAHDKILQVNGIDFTMVTHEKACTLIKKDQLLQLIVYRKSMPTHTPYDTKPADKTLHPVYQQQQQTGYGMYQTYEQSNTSYQSPLASVPNNSFASSEKY